MTRESFPARIDLRYVKAEVVNASRTFFEPVRATVAWAKRGRLRACFVVAASAGASALLLPEQHSLVPSGSDHLSPGAYAISESNQADASRSPHVAAASSSELSRMADAAGVARAVGHLRAAQEAPIKIKIVQNEQSHDDAVAQSALAADMVTTVLFTMRSTSPDDLARLATRLNRLQSSDGYRFKIGEVLLTAAQDTSQSSVRTSVRSQTGDWSAQGHITNEVVTGLARAEAAQGSSFNIVSKDAAGVRGDEKPLAKYFYSLGTSENGSPYLLPVDRDSTSRDFGKAMMATKRRSLQISAIEIKASAPQADAASGATHETESRQP